jgi:starch-binding outer membrane protein, SusD/RagB family
MRNSKIAAVGLLTVSIGLSGCDDFLSGPELTTDPNRPSETSINQLYHGVQVTQFVWHTGDIARVSSMWMQQMAGTGRQQQTRDLYVVGDGDFSFDFSRVYTGGGLVDMRDVQRRAAAANDRTYAGIAKIWEAHLIGMAASLWGPIPYSEAVGENEKPPLDDQQAIYAAVQALLSEAIADLQSGQGAGPGNLDLVYGGDRQKWIQAAHTLRARFYLHWVEAQLAGGNHLALAQTACGGDCISLARDAAQHGISTPEEDFRTFHSANAGEQNMWWQFMNVARAGDIGAGRNLVELLRSRNDPRLTGYFAPVPGIGQVIGVPPGTEEQVSQLSATRGAATFRQPLITYAETQLIRAEAYQRLGQNGPALTHLNNAREAAGLGELTGLTGAALLQEIAIEKYIAMFQQIEAWNDHKRLCTPALRPAGTATALPGRLYYGRAERNVNPNIPAPGRVTDRNPNDPAACPVPAGA